MHFFHSQAPTHHSFTFNSRFLYELKHKVHLSKSVCGIFYFRFRFVFIKVYIFVQQKAWTHLTYVIIPFRINNNRKTTHSFASGPLIFKLQQEVWKFGDICLSWISPKADLETKVLNLGTQSFAYFTFSQ